MARHTSSCFTAVESSPLAQEVLMRRREFIGLAGAATILAGHAELRAELRRKHRIGFLAPTTLVEYADRVEALREGLRRLGYVEGENFAIDQRWAEGKYERLPDLAAELVRSDVELILTWGTPATRAARPRARHLHARRPS